MGVAWPRHERGGKRVPKPIRIDRFSAARSIKGRRKEYRRVYREILREGFPEVFERG